MRKDAGAALDSLNPPQPQYKALKAKLAEAAQRRRRRRQADDPAGPGAEVPGQGQEGQGDQEVLMEDPRVPALRERFGLKAPKATPPTTRRWPTRSPSSRRSTASAPSGQLNVGDARRDQRPQAREDRRHHPRQHGALALGAARPRQDLRDGQHPGLHAARRARRQARLEDQDRGRQAEPADADRSARR